MHRIDIERCIEGIVSVTVYVKETCSVVAPERRVESVVSSACDCRSNSSLTSFSCRLIPVLQTLKQHSTFLGRHETQRTDVTRCPIASDLPQCVLYVGCWMLIHRFDEASDHFMIASPVLRTTSLPSSK